MKTVRFAFSMVGTLLLAGGYLASQYSYFFGDPTAYSRALDQSSVPILSLILLLGCMTLAFVHNGGEPE